VLAPLVPAPAAATTTTTTTDYLWNVHSRVGKAISMLKKKIVENTVEKEKEAKLTAQLNAHTLQ
jgi:hypothetical protein